MSRCEISSSARAESTNARRGLPVASGDVGKPQEARELLPPVYGWFAEGFDTLDLKGAKTLLDELHA